MRGRRLSRTWRLARVAGRADRIASRRATAARVARVVAIALAALFAATADAIAITMVDDAGRSFELARPPRRIVSLAPSLTELVFAAGGGASLVGTSALSDYPPAARAIARIGDAGRLDVERVIALRPDLVLIWQRGATSRELEQLEAGRHPPVPARAASPRRRRPCDRAPRRAARPRGRGQPPGERDPRRARAAARSTRRRRAGDGLLPGLAASRS
jgi:iron complex transport system substrate-binding protein